MNIRKGLGALTIAMTVGHLAKVQADGRHRTYCGQEGLLLQ